MIRKIIGIALLVIGGLIALVLLTYGGPIFPHIIGPIALTIIGSTILLFKRKAKA